MQQILIISNTISNFLIFNKILITLKKSSLKYFIGNFKNI